MGTTSTADNPGDETAVSFSSKLHIRLANSLHDLERLRPLTLELHAESRFSEIPCSQKKHDDLFTHVLDEPERYAMLIAECHSEPVGYLFCVVGEYLIGYRDLLATVYAFYVRRQYRSSLLGGKAALRLLRGTVKWSKARQVKEIMLHVTSGIDIRRTDKFLRRAGFEVIGANYALQLKGGENKS